MGSPYVGEIRIFAGNFPPVGWAFCDGTQMQISQNDTLYNLIGTTYGGDGQSTFNLPDLRGRAPVHWGNSAMTGQSYVLGQVGGAETVTLITAQIPSHSHPIVVNSTAGNSASPANAYLSAGGPAGGTGLSPYSTYGEGTQTPSSPNATTVVGGSQPHENMQPYLGVNFIISLFGIYPSQS